MLYRIRCYVWGGVTGSRESWLKRNDEVYETSSKDEAEKLASENRVRTMGNPNRTANFDYRVVEMF